jgi:hypothetical protein
LGGAVDPSCIEDPSCAETMKNTAPAPVPLLLPLTLGCLLWLAPGCAHVPVEERPASRIEAAREALHGGQFASADSMLSALAAAEPETAQGHQALFLLGVLHLDPRNPAWSPAEAEIVLARYLEFPFGEHRPEAVALYALARRLAAPMPRVARVPAGEGRSGGAAPPAAAGGGAGEGDESERLRREIADRDRELAKLREELERIRRRLSPPG